jgi:hypothetical protein
VRPVLWRSDAGIPAITGSSCSWPRSDFFQSLVLAFGSRQWALLSALLIPAYDLVIDFGIQMGLSQDGLMPNN